MSQFFLCHDFAKIQISIRSFGIKRIIAKLATFASFSKSLLVKAALLSVECMSMLQVLTTMSRPIFTQFFSLYLQMAVVLDHS